MTLLSGRTAIIIVSLGCLILSYGWRTAPLNIFQPALVDKSEHDADVLIIGGSHAGHSGALTLARHQHDSIIFDDGSPRNRWNTPTHALPTWEYHEPKELRAASRRELQATGLVNFVDERIVTIEKASDSLFHATSASGRTWRGRKLMLAMGVDFVYPEIPGYTDNFPEKILHCLFTRGFEFRGSASAGVIAADLASSPPHAVILGEDASKFAENVTIYTNGDQNLAKEISKILHQRGEKNVPVDSRKITRIERVTATDSVKLHFEQGDERTESFLVHQPATKVSEVFVSQLGLETNPRGDIVTKMPFYQTNVSGVFAAGDSASPFKMIPNAMFQGSNAGAGIARELPRRLTGNKVNRLQNGQLATWLQSLK